MAMAVGISFLAGMIWEGLFGCLRGWKPKVIDLATWIFGAFVGWGLVRLMQL